MSSARVRPGVVAPDHRARLRRLLARPLLGLAVPVLALASPAQAQDPQPNLAYLQNFGTGGYDAGGQTLRAL